MSNQQNELRALIAYEIGVLCQAYNPAVIFDTLNVLHQICSVNDLRLMITNEHSELAGISETIQTILSDTYSAAAMGIEPGNCPCMGDFDESGDIDFMANTHIPTPATMVVRTSVKMAVIKFSGPTEMPNMHGNNTDYVENCNNIVLAMEVLAKYYTPADLKLITSIEIS